jgi:hypothetical protein
VTTGVSGRFPRHRQRGRVERRQRVADGARVGIGVCGALHAPTRCADGAMPDHGLFARLGRAQRPHWDAWMSGKPVLTDRVRAARDDSPSRGGRRALSSLTSRKRFRSGERPVACRRRPRRIA